MNLKKWQRVFGLYQFLQNFTIPKLLAIFTQTIITLRHRGRSTMMDDFFICWPRFQSFSISIGRFLPSCCQN